MRDNHEASARLQTLDSGELNILRSISTAPMWHMKWGDNGLTSVMVAVKCYEYLLGSDLRAFESDEGGIDLYEVEQMCADIVKSRGDGVE